MQGENITPDISKINVSGNIRKIHIEKRDSLLRSQADGTGDLDFQKTEGALHIINWQDCLSQMSSDILDRQALAEESDWSFMKSSIVQYLFTICIRLRLPNDVRYTAALIFSTYMRRQIMQLHQFIEDQNMSAAQRAKEWEKIETTAERQIPLRLMSCIQISSKMHSYHESLSSRQVVNCLRALSLPYTLAAVQASESRVFRMIGNKVPESPLAICETAMKILTYLMRNHDWADESKLNMIWQHVLVILDICMLYHSLIYEKFIARLPAHNFPTNDSPAIILAKFKWDFLLLATSVIKTAVFCVEGSMNLNLITKVLVKILKTDERNAILLHESIIELIGEQR